MWQQRARRDKNLADVDDSTAWTCREEDARIVDKMYEFESESCQQGFPRSLHSKRAAIADGTNAAEISQQHSTLSLQILRLRPTIVAPPPLGTLTRPASFTTFASTHLRKQPSLPSLSSSAPRSRHGTAMAEPNLQEIHDFLVDIAKKAGQKISSANPIMTVDIKKNSSDLVTETDKAVEDMVSSSLKEKYPDYKFLGEESSPTPTSSLLTPAPTFICDPIDGTTNFVHAFPYISISLAFAHNLVPLVGVVYNPFTQHLYHAIKGHGAFLSCPEIPSSFPGDGGAVQARYVKRQIPLRSPAPPLEGLSKALVAVEWGNERKGSNWEAKTKTFSALAGEDGGMVHSLRSLGSAALNCCGVAAGFLDAYWEGGCWAWDVAAGWVVVTEAGGRVVGGNPGEEEVRVDARRYLVVRGGEGQTQMIQEFWGKLGGKLTYEGSGELELNDQQLKG